jgi:hypothetical protein
LIGKSKVLEQGHSLILGWSDKTLPLCQELCLANESMNGGVIVILAELEKEEMASNCVLLLLHNPCPPK